MNFTDSPTILLTSSDIKSLEDQCARMTAEIAEIEQKKKEAESRRAHLIGKLERIRALLIELGIVQPDSSMGHPLGIPTFTDSKSDAVPDKRRGRRSVWSDEIQRLLVSSEYQSMTYERLKAAIETGPLGDQFKASEKGYYHSITRMIARGDLIKQNQRLFTPAGYKSFTEDAARGVVDEAFTLSIRPSPIADAIINIIDGCEDGASGSEIIADLMKDERFSGPVGRNHSSAYNVLARLVDRGQVQKRDRLYYPIHVVMPDGGQELPLDGPQQEKGLEANASSPINSLEEGDQTGTV